MVIYIFCAVFVLMAAAWAIYVLPTPGPLSAWELSGAIYPAMLMFAGVLGVLLSFWLTAKVTLLGFRVVRRWRRR
ncbi:hypothetical protein WH87_03930 [Devosia epidermidihirudinis]|uniref:Uncharacterized protein n=1 Tax=Devosia epidermidihirudinis TaxID=1293439 RepID=A0A0F5QF78_9HYPH|nr:hypothetical protein [Devosia epidermidihirudinis]KKC39373.1 hypothetical protein WH87_03930 [Devosia epidermidihirudinis]